MPQLPPGPRFSWVQTFKVARDPFGYYPRCRDRYGDPFTIPAMNGTVVVTGDPDGVREIFTADPGTYEPFAVEALESLLGTGSVIVRRGDAHLKERRLLAPAFHGARMRAYGDLMREVAERHVAAFRPGEPFEMRDVTQSISLEVIVRAVFGVGDDDAVSRFRAAVRELGATLSPLPLFFKSLQRDFFGLTPWRRFLRASAALDAMLFAEMRARRESGARGEDILSLLLDARYDDGSGMSDAEIRDELVTLLFAGHETTGVALAWALAWLHRQPETLARLEGELREAGDGAAPDRVADLPWLSAVCQETLRLYPIVPDIVRMLRRPLNLRGYEVPAGYGVAPVAALLHHDERLYPDPYAFRPERFLERKYGPYEYIPFGGGHRRCLGVAFASYEMKLVLATLVRAGGLRLAAIASLTPVRRNVTMGPRSVTMVWEGVPRAA